VFQERDLELLQGHIAVGHTRYSTTGSPSFENAQPTLGPTPFGTVALAHNGNLTNFDELEALADSRSDHAHRVVAEATKKRTRTRAFRDSSNDT
ncbi:amidophosphoribosyltransferase, partial [Burkholderia multivorans]